MAPTPDPKSLNLQRVTATLQAALRIIEDYPDLHMGPSVPFVVGALQDPIGAAPVDESKAQNALSVLLTELRAAPRGRGVRIQWCRNIKAYVITSMPLVDGLAWDVKDCRPDDFHGLINTLWAQYGTSMMRGEFSIDDSVWHSLTLDEIRTIAQLRDGEPLSG
jgi:hypothetical protein